MDIISAIVVIIFVLLALAVCVFMFGPYILEEIVDKIEEWEDLLDSLKGEK